MCVRIFSLTFLVLFFTGCPEFFYIPPPPPSPPPSPTLPSITQQPQDLVVKTGEEARFEVWFSSNAKEFRWGTKNPEGQISYYNWSPTDGWTWASITFPSASLSQSGTQIWLEARNSAGTTSSRKATLTVLPHASTTLTYVAVTPSNSSLRYVLENSDGEKLFVLSEYFKTIGGGYISSNGKLWTFWFNSSGLPEYVVSEGWTLRYYNYTNSTVNVDAISPSGELVTYIVALDQDDRADLERLRVLSNHISEGKSIFSDLFNVVSSALKITCCIGGIVSSPTGAGLLAAAPCCIGSLVDIGSRITGDDLTNQGDLVINTISCATSTDGSECIDLGVTVLEQLIEESEAERDAVAPILNPSIGLRLDGIWGPRSSCTSGNPILPRFYFFFDGNRYELTNEEYTLGERGEFRIAFEDIPNIIFSPIETMQGGGWTSCDFCLEDIWVMELNGNSLTLASEDEYNHNNPPENLGELGSCEHYQLISP